MLSGADSDGFERLGAALAETLRDGDVIFLTGPLGAGKTSLTQAIARGLGIQEDVVSPTFNIVCIYESGRVPLNHFDLYRLEGPEQLDDVDFWALADEGTPGASLIEWADLFPDDMPDEGLTISIAYAGEGADARDVSMSAVGARASAVLDRMTSVLCSS